MFGMDAKSLVIGAAVGYLVLPRLVAAVMGLMSK